MQDEFVVFHRTAKKPGAEIERLNRENELIDYLKICEQIKKGPRLVKGIFSY